MKDETKSNKIQLNSDQSKRFFEPLIPELKRIIADRKKQQEPKKEQQ